METFALSRCRSLAGTGQHFACPVAFDPKAFFSWGAGLEFRLQTSSRKELTRWILSWMPHVKVLAPRQLRDRVRQRMREGLARCG